MQKDCLTFLQTVLFEFNNIIWCAPDDFTELFQCHHGDILALFQRVQCFIVNAASEQLIL